MPKGSAVHKKMNRRYRWGLDAYSLEDMYKLTFRGMHV